MSPWEIDFISQGDEKFINFVSLIISKFRYLNSLSLLPFMPKRIKIYSFYILFDIPYFHIIIYIRFFEGSEGAKPLRFFEKWVPALSITWSWPQKDSHFLSDNYQFEANTISSDFEMRRSNTNLMKFPHPPRGLITDLRHQSRKLINATKMILLSPLYLYYWHFIFPICMQDSQSKVGRS